jgi:hypothetical protein
MNFFSIASKNELNRHIDKINSIAVCDDDDDDTATQPQRVIGKCGTFFLCVFFIHNIEKVIF